MYPTINHDEIYFLLNVNENTRIKIGDKKDLIKHVARMMEYDMRHQLWDALYKWGVKRFENEVLGRGQNVNNVFAEQNLTGKDGFTTVTTSYQTIYDDPDDSESNHRSCTNVYTKHLYPYVFHTEQGAIFDIRLIIDDIRACLISGDYKYYRNFNWRYNSRRRKYVSHGYSRSFKLKEFKTMISCEEQGVHYRRKALPHGGLDPWGDYKSSRHSNGWKDKSNKKQWMHNVINKRLEPLSLGRAYFRDYELNQELESLELENQIDTQIESIYDAKSAVIINDSRVNIFDKIFNTDTIISLYGSKSVIVLIEPQESQLI